MVDNIVNYIREGREKGFSDDSLRNRLLEGGFDERDVDEAFNRLEDDSKEIESGSEQSSFNIKGLVIGAAVLVVLIVVALVLFFVLSGNKSNVTEIRFSTKWDPNTDFEPVPFNTLAESVIRKNEENKPYSATINLTSFYSDFSQANNSYSNNPSLGDCSFASNMFRTLSDPQLEGSINYYKNSYFPGPAKVGSKTINFSLKEFSEEYQITNITVLHKASYNGSLDKVLKCTATGERPDEVERKEFGDYQFSEALK